MKHQRFIYRALWVKDPRIEPYRFHQHIGCIIPLSTLQPSSHPLRPFRSFSHPNYLPKLSPVIAMDTSLYSREQIKQLQTQNQSRVQDRMKKYVDLIRKERKFEVEDLVYLRLQPYGQISVAQCKNTKLASKIPLVFHVSLLKKKVSTMAVPMMQLPLVYFLEILKLEQVETLDRLLYQVKH